MALTHYVNLYILINSLMTNMMKREPGHFCEQTYLSSKKEAVLL